MKAAVLDPENEFNVERTLTKDDVKKLIRVRFFCKAKKIMQWFLFFSFLFFFPSTFIYTPSLPAAPLLLSPSPSFTLKDLRVTAIAS